MIFLYPEILWFIIFPIIFAITLLINKKKKFLNIFSPQIYKKLLQSNSSISSGLRITFFTLALVMMIIALAQPVIEKEKIKIDQKVIDIIVAMDISRSMEAKDLFPNRLQWAKKKLLELISITQTVRIGVMAFAQNAYVVTPITQDKDVAKYLVNNLDTKNITEKGTNLLQLLDASNKQLENSLYKYILLITDGGDNKNFSKEIAFAKKNRLTLFVLSVASKKGAPIENENGDFIKRNGNIILTQLNEKIKNLALQTGGVYIQSIASNEDVITMLIEIKKIAKFKTVKTENIRTFIELFIYFLIVAILLLLLAFHSLPHKNIVAIIFLSIIIIYPKNSYAGITDFKIIKEAKQAYYNKKYKNAQKALSNLKINPSTEINYNIGNTLYKQKKYKEAISYYKKAMKNEKLKQKALHNIGNSSAYLKKFDQAIKAYENSLKLGEDKQTRENLEIVKKLRDKKKKKKKNQKDQNKNKSDKKDQNKKKNKSDKKNQNKKKNKDQNSKTKDKKKNMKKNKKSSKKEESRKASKVKKQKLNDKEEKKLLKLLQQRKGQTFKYKIPSKFQQENDNDKPW